MVQHLIWIPEQLKISRATLLSMHRGLEIKTQNWFCFGSLGSQVKYCNIKMKTKAVKITLKFYGTFDIAVGGKH